MIQPSLAIFSNFFIDNEERLQRMKDSFYSFKDIEPSEWIINIRGSLKYEAGNFLKTQLKDFVQIYHIESKRGWMYDSLTISESINSEFIFYWLEDHLLISSIQDLSNCILEMKQFNVDQLWYSFLINEIKDQFELIEPHKVGKHINVIKLDMDNCKKIRDKVGEFYTVSCVSIMRKNFFLNILSSKKPLLKRWHRNLPFDFEKLSKDEIFPVIWHALPNKELFVSIDDDLCQQGYSLISRGLYPNRISREEMKKKEFGFSNEKRQKLRNLIPKKLRPIIIQPYKNIKRVYYTLDLFWNNL